MPVFATERGGRLQIVLPQTEWKELKKVVEAYAERLQDRKATETRLHTLRNERERAERKDTSALKKWLKDGKKARHHSRERCETSRTKSPRVRVSSRRSMTILMTWNRN